LFFLTHSEIRAGKGKSLWCLPATIIEHSLLLLQERSFWRKCVIVMDREPNCDSARSIHFIPFGPNGYSELAFLCNGTDRHKIRI